MGESMQEHLSEAKSWSCAPITAGATSPPHTNPPPPYLFSLLAPIQFPGGQELRASPGLRAVGLIVAKNLHDLPPQRKSSPSP